MSNEQSTLDTSCTSAGGRGLQRGTHTEPSAAECRAARMHLALGVAHTAQARSRQRSTGRRTFVRSMVPQGQGQAKPLAAASVVKPRRATRDTGDAVVHGSRHRSSLTTAHLLSSSPSLLPALLARVCTTSSSVPLRVAPGAPQHTPLASSFLFSLLSIIILDFCFVITKTK